MTKNAKRGEIRHYSEKEPWEKVLDNLNRSDRRREAVWRKSVVKIDANLMSQVTTNSRRLLLNRLNALGPEAG
jgi:hypothetical protein